MFRKKGPPEDFIKNTLLSSNHLCMIFRVECDENCKVGPSCFRPFTRSLSQLTDSRKAISTRVPWCLFAIRLILGLYYKIRIRQLRYTANVYRALWGLCRFSLLWGNPAISTNCREILYLSLQSVNVTGFPSNIHNLLGLFCAWYFLLT